MISNRNITSPTPSNVSHTQDVKTQTLSGVVYDTHEVYDTNELYETAKGLWEYPHQNVIRNEVKPSNINTRTL